VWQKLRLLRERGVTMVLTTHYMDEAERLCDRLVIMDGGKILDEGRPRDLIQKHAGEEVVELRLLEADEARVLEPLDVARVPSERAGDTRVFFFERRSPLAEQLVERARAVHVGCQVRNATLEDVFLKLTGRELVE
jgi:lipooligosaccharide transport system ATP-binding protein